MRSNLFVGLLIVSWLGAGPAFAQPLDGGRELSQKAVSRSQILSTPLENNSRLRESGAEGTSQPSRSTGNLGVVIGDQLKVSIFMEYGSGNGISTNNQGVLPTIMERPDLSGDYTVDEHGVLFLPIAGAVKAVGLSLSDLATRIEKAYARQQEAEMRAGVQLLERQPVYVTGNVPSPAVLKHTPGMTVLQAALLAGAAYGVLGGDQAQRQIDITRERERVQQSADRLAKALARRLVLMAERDGQAPKVSLSLHQIAQARADSTLQQATKLREAERRKIQEEIRALDTTVTAMNAELALLRDNGSRAVGWIADLEQRVRELEPMFKKGSVNSLTMFAARSDLVSAQEKQQETKASIARLERDIAQTNASKSQLVITDAFECEKALQEVENDIHQEEITQNTMGLLTPRFDVSSLGAASVAHPKYSLVRQTSEGPKKLDVDENDTLQPGDILKILDAPRDRLTDERL